MTWDVAMTQPTRNIILVGDRLGAALWLIIRRPQCRLAERVSGVGGLWGLSAKKVHVVLLPTHRQLRFPRLVRAGVWILRQRGATVERV
jgi:hypothetical protein